MMICENAIDDETKVGNDLNNTLHNLLLLEKPQIEMHDQETKINNKIC